MSRVFIGPGMPRNRPRARTAIERSRHLLGRSGAWARNQVGRKTPAKRNCAASRAVRSTTHQGRALRGVETQPDPGTGEFRQEYARLRGSLVCAETDRWLRSIGAIVLECRAKPSGMQPARLGSLNERRPGMMPGHGSVRPVPRKRPCFIRCAVVEPLGDYGHGLVTESDQRQRDRHPSDETGNNRRATHHPLPCLPTNCASFRYFFNKFRGPSLPVSGPLFLES